MKEQNNFMMAILLSMGVLLGWQFFVTEPRLAAERAAQMAAEEAQAANADAPRQTDAPQADAQISPQAADKPARIKADNGFADSPRLQVQTPRLSGSIALMGARFDDLILRDYGAHIGEDAPRQRLLAREGTPGHWQAHHGFVAAQGNPVTLPDETSLWQIVEGRVLTPQTPVTLRHVTPEGVVLEQHISVDENYLFTIRQSAQNASDNTLTLYPFGQMTRTGRPQTTDLFILHEGPIGYFGEEGEGLLEIDYDDLGEDGPVKTTAEEGWLGITDKYWATALIPPQNTKFTGRFVARAEDGAAVYRGDYLLAGQSLAPGAQMQATSRFFAGAKKVDLIDGYAEAGLTRFDLLIDWGWFYFLTKPMFLLLRYLSETIGNFGIAILLITVMVKAIFFPLANRSYRAMSKMKKLGPEMTKIRERFKDDRQRQQQEMMALYRKEGANPVSGCLPILVQIPVFFALYKVLFVTIEMRHTPFFGWIQDLSAPDPLNLFTGFGLLPITLPEIIPVIGIWPILMGISMWLQQRLNPQPMDKMQARIFMLLPIVFTFILAPFPAGLVIYWTWNNILSIAQQWVIMRQAGIRNPAAVE